MNRAGLLLLAALITACGDVQRAADRVFVNGSVYTVNAERSRAEAVAVSRGRIVFVGDNSGAEAWIGVKTDVIDLDGQMLLPGFHDSHAHVLIGMLAEKECDLLRIYELAAVLGKLQECTSLEGFGEARWINGAGWEPFLFPVSGPDKQILDELFSDRPVYLEDSFGHSGWVNSRALEVAGIDANTPDPEGGRIERDPVTGEATGTLRETAVMLIKAHIPPMTPEYEMRRVKAGIEHMHRFGITALIEPGLHAAEMQPLLQLADAGEFDIRALVSISPRGYTAGTFGDEIYEFVEQRADWRRANIDVDSVKIYMDGVIESGTSPLLEPYEDPAYGSGEFFYEQEKVDEYFTWLDANGFQLHVHAIGDAAVRRALNGFEAMREANGVSGNRHHMVHLQLIHEDDISRFAELDVTATFQALWAHPDAAALDIDVPMIGRERTWQMYPIASVQETGGRIAGGSDYWVTEIDPLLAIESAVTRQDPWTNEGPVLNEDERADLETMIDAYTINGAYLMKLENEQGSIEVGKRADFVVLDRDLFSIPSSEISEARVTMTIFDGRSVYESVRP